MGIEAAGGLFGGDQPPDRFALELTNAPFVSQATGERSDLGHICAQEPGGFPSCGEKWLESLKETT